MLVWFGLVYGNLNALVFAVVGGSLWVETVRGRAACSRIFVDSGTCRVWILVALAVLFGTSTVLSVRRLLSVWRANKSTKQGGPDA